MDFCYRYPAGDMPGIPSCRALLANEGQGYYGGEEDAFLLNYLRAGRTIIRKDIVKNDIAMQGILRKR
jgi:hypothetical protein